MRHALLDRDSSTEAGRTPGFAANSGEHPLPSGRSEPDGEHVGEGQLEVLGEHVGEGHAQPVGEHIGE